MRRSFSRGVAVRVGLGALGLALMAPAMAQAQQGFAARLGLPSNFWAGQEAHTIVSLDEAARYQVCNLLHTSGPSQQRPVLEVDADGDVVQVHQGRCTDVDGATITVRSASQGTAHGSYRPIN